MPSNLLTADSSFPNLSEGSTAEKFEQISSYMFMLLEQLRYTMSNLGQDNFNKTELDDIADIIRDPVYAQLKNTNGQVASLALTAEGLSSRLGDAEGNITLLSQTVNGLALSVTNGSTSSTIALVSNGVVIDSQIIRLSGMVTFSDLSTVGKTTICGDNITTGKISAITMESCTFKSLLQTNGEVGGEYEMYYGSIASNNLAGGVRLDVEGLGTEQEAQYRMFIYTNTVGGKAFALKFVSAGGVSIEGNTALYFKGNTTATVTSGTKTLIASSKDVYVEGVNVYLKGKIYINGKQYSA